MRKINKNSTALRYVEATANVGIGITTGRAVGMLARALLPAEIDMATRIGLNLITYSIGLATSRTIRSEVSNVISAYNIGVASHNMRHDQTVY